MPIGMPLLTEGPFSHEAQKTEPGMAFFAATGPFGETCGNCRFLGYKTTSRKEYYNSRADSWEPRLVRRSGCEMFKKLSGKHGPPISENLEACKYFEAKTPAKG